MRRTGQIFRIVTAGVWEYRQGRRSLPDAVHRMLVRLGPTFIKLGQVASTRPDLVPPEISHRLQELQEGIPPFDYRTAVETIESELALPVDEAFRSFPADPVASASLSQVYFAELPDGTPVAVKVQRPDLRPLIERDLAILGGLTRLATLVRPSLRTLRPRTAVEEFGRWTLQELDFEVEGQNLDEFRANFADWDDIVFPVVYWSHTTPKVLTMQRVAGMRLWEVPQRVGATFSGRIARRLAELEMKMFISDQFFHADLHPGNIFFEPDGGMAILDVGMVGRMSPGMRDRFLAYWIAVTRRQRGRAFHHLLAMAQSTDGADLEGFRIRYEELLDRFYDVDLADRSLAQTYLEIVVAGSRHGVVFPPELILQAKAVVTAEALDLVLAPEFRFAEEVRPIVARELAKRATPSRLLDRLWSGLVEWTLLGEWPATAELPTTAEPDEEGFRRAALEAVSAEWADSADRRLFSLQADLSRYVSAEHWQSRPELQALLESLLGLGWQTATGLSRAQRGAQLDHIPNGNGHLDDHSAMPGNPDYEGVGRQLRSIARKAQQEIRRLDVATSPADRWQAHTALSALLALLRSLVGRTERAIIETIRSPDRNPAASDGTPTGDDVRAQSIRDRSGP